MVKTGDIVNTLRLATQAEVERADLPLRVGTDTATSVSSRITSGPGVGAASSSRFSRGSAVHRAGDSDAANFDRIRGLERWTPGRDFVHEMPENGGSLARLGPFVARVAKIPSPRSGSETREPPP